MKAKATEKAANINIFGDISAYSWDDNAVSAAQFVKDLAALGELDNISVSINSRGGHVFDGNVIHNALVSHKAKITVRVEGLAASIASVIAMAGDHVIMPANSLMMIHNPSSGAWGEAKDLRKEADVLDSVKDSLVASYKRKSSLTTQQLVDAMNEETWYSPEQAVDAGFADEIVGAVDATNAFDVSRYKNTPKEYKNSYTGEVPKMPPEDKAKAPEITVEYLAEHHPSIVAQLHKAGAALELQRIAAIDDLAIPGHENLIKACKAEGKSPEQTAMAMIAAEKLQKQAFLTATATDAPAPVAPSLPTPTAQIDKNAPVEDRCKTAWDTSPDIRAEFGDDGFKAFLAFTKADEKGRVRKVGGKVQ